jgi:protoporphyrinogen IX oxidase
MILWLKALHLIAMVCWFAGLFYLPRLFVYHTTISPHDTASYDRFCTMERRLFWGITTPSAFFTLLFGTGLFHSLHYSLSTLPSWLFWKLVLIGTLVIYHAYCGKITHQFKKQTNSHLSTFYRCFNEYPVIVLIGTILLAVLKPVF